MSPESTEKPPFPSESQDEKKTETAEEQDKDGEGQDGQNNKKNKKKNKRKGKKQDEGTDTNDENNYDAKDEVNIATDEPTQGDQPEQGSEVTQTEVEKNEEDHDQSKMQKSPLLTSHRLSTSSSLDEVNLMNSKEDEPTDKTQGPGDKTEPPPLPPKDDSAPPASAGLMGLSGGLPSIPWAAPPVNKNPPIPQPAPPRKPSGPFAWFSRSSTSTTAKDIKSPPHSASRRNTATSVSTLGSNLDHIARDGDDVSSVGSKKPRRNSLKDQFKMLRLREESHAPELDQTSVRSGQASISQSGASPPIIPEEGEEGILAASGAISPSTTVAPGRTGSVVDASTPVDWEMWQHLVNNGPQALASSEELNAAIKRGIPQTIRGVIWQILADCQTADLEDIYRDLVARGTAQDKDGRTGTETTSSRSSVRSHHSGSGSRSSSAAPSPSREGDADKLSKEHASNDADRVKKAKTDAVALQKLEKVIRRDLGARTSYAKYFVSQGSQEGLFGLCKAYALYDPGVGYAQGMSFIAMPLLFNVSIPSIKLIELIG